MSNNALVIVESERFRGPVKCYFCSASRPKSSDQAMKKYLTVLPFILLCLIVAFAWYTIIVNHYSLAIKNIAALVFILINLPLYFFRHTAARITTGLILLLAACSAIQLTVDVFTNQLYYRYRCAEDKHTAYPLAVFLSPGILLYRKCVISTHVVARGNCLVQ